MNSSRNLLVLGVTGQVGKLVAANLRRSEANLSVGTRRKATVAKICFNHLMPRENRSVGAGLAGKSIAHRPGSLKQYFEVCPPKQFRTRLTTNAKEFRLELCDDGDGFKVRERHDGAGLAGMRERAEEMGGELNIVSSRGKGTTITVILPRGASPQPAGQPKLTRTSTGAGMEPAL